MKKYFLALMAFGCGFVSTADAVQYTGDNSRDPFSEPPALRRQETSMASAESKVSPQFTLNGIIWVPGKPRAIINGRRVMEGAEINGAKVVEIRRKEVTMLLNGQEMVLKKLTGET